MVCQMSLYAAVLWLVLAIVIVFALVIAFVVAPEGHQSFFLL